MIPIRSFRIGGVVAALAVATLLLAGCGPDADGEPAEPVDAERSEPVEHPDAVARASVPPGYIFESLPQLVATSEIVVLGTVQSAAKGERVVPDEPLFNRDVVVHVEQQLAGPPLSSDTVVVHEGGYDGDVSFEREKLRWLYPGDRAVYFLAHPPNALKNHYEIIATPGRLQLAKDGTITTKADDPVARKLDGQPWATVLQQVTAGVRTAVSQEVKPLAPGPFGRD